MLQGLLNFVDGVKGAHRGNFIRHIKAGGLHDWAKTYFSVRKMNCGSDQNEPPTSIGLSRKSTYLSPVVSENYSRLFVTALFIALKERPLADFSGLVDLEKKNGLKFFGRKDARSSLR